MEGDEDLSLLLDENHRRLARIEAVLQGYSVKSAVDNSEAGQASAPAEAPKEDARQLVLVS
jgi:hypothetical protein